MPTQYGFLSSPHPRRLLRAGNQWGKTTAGAIDLIAHTTGFNPWCPSSETPGPIEAWVICASWSQSLAIQRKIYELLPKELLHPDTRYDEVRGFRGTNPAFRIRHKSGGYSLVRVKTMGQGGLRLASATIQYAWFDEPPESARIYSEITKRVMRAGALGRLIMTLTPVNARVDWIQDAAERGVLEDHHARMVPEEYVPMRQAQGGQWVRGVEPMRLLDNRPCDAEWIAEQIAQTLPHEVPVVCHGEWRMISESPRFPAFDRGLHVSSTAPVGPVQLYLGIDHGVLEYTQTALLVAVQRGDQDRVWVLDEYVGQRETTEADDAEGILALLERQGLQWSQVDGVYGDRAHAGQGRGPTVAGKSNARLATALARHPRAAMHGIRGELYPGIRPAKQGVSNRAGSVAYGCAWLHRAMVGRRFVVHPRCRQLVDSIVGYDGSQNSPESHLVDALRYSLRLPIWRDVEASHAVLVA